MKKISLVVMGLALTTMSFAQHVQFGLKAGVNLADIDDSQAPTDKRTAYHFGALAHIHLSRSWAIQPEVVYSAQGAEYNEAAYNGTDKVNYINVPVLIQYMTPQGLRFQAGPQVGFLTSAKFKNRVDENEIDIEDVFDNADFSVALGVGYLTPIGLGVDARYNLGVNNVYKNENPSAKNNVWQFGLFYQFPARMRGRTTTAQ
jgi:hypothetical protein